VHLGEADVQRWPPGPQKSDAGQRPVAGFLNESVHARNSLGHEGRFIGPETDEWRTID
jgi:hypothetical protein